MAYYVTCPNCGANLDHGERCDCLEELKKSVRSEKTKDAKGLNKGDFLHQRKKPKQKITSHINYYIPEEGGLSNEIKH